MSTVMSGTMALVFAIILSLATYVRTEHEIENQLARQAREIVSEHLEVNSGGVRIRETESAESLVTALRRYDLSMLIYLSKSYRYLNLNWATRTNNTVMLSAWAGCMTPTHSHSCLARKR
ncbi:MAG: hypothetical protein UX67_C0002G0031 [Candidatus Woesebacteria bacterium GW2011_GWF2_46_8]|uniref:Uncharacterized protein n=1 Tax=Candidatus Woesebacteria bacterium GW2011_GWF2_46_8 TaxID=1618604 RepID=A0A0G1QWL0_9BACT|nr:MAG: hypothetical protein UX67_C0002G0031 [Candidatus Woesebacteria bacterium GW2011_GWF2_46_8]